MSIIIRKFTEHGIHEFEYLLTMFREAKKIDDDELNKLVFNDVYTQIMDSAAPLILKNDDNKLTIAKAICESLKLEDNKAFDKDAGLWTWLAAIMLKKLVSTEKKALNIKFSDDNSLYIYKPAFNRYYRHLVAFPSLIYSTLKDKGKIFLRGGINERGEIVEQLAASQEVQRNPGVIEAATILYYDSAKDDIVKGAASKPNEEKNIGGQSSRFRLVLKQLLLTYDLNAMNGNQIVDLLPKEFDRWRIAS